MNLHNYITVKFLLAAEHLSRMVDPIIKDMRSRNLFNIVKSGARSDVTILFLDDIEYFFQNQKQQIKYLLHDNIIAGGSFLVVNLHRWDGMCTRGINNISEYLKNRFREVEIECPEYIEFLEFEKGFTEKYVDAVADTIIEKILTSKEEEIRIELSQELKTFLTEMYTKDKDQFEELIESTVKKVFKEKISSVKKKYEEKESTNPIVEVSDWCKNNDISFTIVNASNIESSLSFQKKLEEMKDCPVMDFVDMFQSYFVSSDNTYKRAYYKSVFESEKITTVMDLLQKKFNPDKLSNLWYLRFLNLMFDNGFFLRNI